MANQRCRITTYSAPRHMKNGVLYDGECKGAYGFTLYTRKGKVVGGHDPSSIYDLCPMRAMGRSNWEYVEGVYTPSQFNKKLYDRTASLSPYYHDLRDKIRYI